MRQRAVDCLGACRERAARGNEREELRVRDGHRRLQRTARGAVTRDGDQHAFGVILVREHLAASRRDDLSDVSPQTGRTRSRSRKRIGVMRVQRRNARIKELGFAYPRRWAISFGCNSDSSSNFSD